MSLIALIGRWLRFGFAIQKEYYITVTGARKLQNLFRFLGNNNVTKVEWLSC